ncbi:Uncharacterised protein [Bacteroides pyogenes]|nr:Uncharacterised protein [Bacteroides pyogenes]
MSGFLFPVSMSDLSVQASGVEVVCLFRHILLAALPAFFLRYAALSIRGRVTDEALKEVFFLRYAALSLQRITFWEKRIKFFSSFYDMRLYPLFYVLAGCLFPDYSAFGSGMTALSGTIVLLVFSFHTAGLSGPAVRCVSVRSRCSGVPPVYTRKRTVSDAASPVAFSR